MGGIPLPALAIRPPEQPDLLGNVGKVSQLQNLAQQHQLGQAQLQSDQMKNQLEAQQLQDQQTVRQVLGQNQGNLGASLPQLAGKVSPQTFMSLAKAHLEVT